MGNVRASVTLDYDQAATEETAETYDPDQTVTLSMQRTDQTTGSQLVAAGVPGAASNAPNAQALPVYPQQNSQPQAAKTESATYGVAKTVRHVIENPGRVRRLTAAIVVNDRLAQLAAKGKAAVWQPRSPDEIRNLTALAQAAVGFDPARGDMLTVEDLSFDENRAAPPVSILKESLSTAENSPVLVKYAAIFAAVLVILAFGVRPALRQAKQKPAVRELPGSTGVGHAPALSVPEIPEVDPERQRTQQIFDQVTDHLKREPAQSSRLLQSWIHSD
jgi:flagellar M-ring protein FliF